MIAALALNLTLYNQVWAREDWSGGVLEQWPGIERMGLKGWKQAPTPPPVCLFMDDICYDGF